MKEAARRTKNSEEMEGYFCQKSEYDAATEKRAAASRSAFHARRTLSTGC